LALLADSKIGAAARDVGLALPFLCGVTALGHVQIDAEKLAAHLDGGIFRGRVYERLHTLKERGYLVRIRRAAPGQAAVWAIEIPA
jgi:hypothetical protein